MVVYTGTFIPYEFEMKEQALRYVIDRGFSIKHSLRFVEKDTEHLTVRCPVSGEYIEIVGKEEDVEWLHSQLHRRQMYRLT